MLDTTMVLDGVTYKTGDTVTCTIDRTTILDAKIYIFSKREASHQGYDFADYSFEAGERLICICNNRKANNMYENSFFKYKYSYMFLTNNMPERLKYLKIYNAPYVNPKFNPEPKKDLLKVFIDNVISFEQKKFNDGVLNGS